MSGSGQYPSWDRTVCNLSGPGKTRVGSSMQNRFSKQSGLVDAALCPVCGKCSTALGPYPITGPPGKRGMGEVRRARDTKLGREVAIKTLPEEFAKDADRQIADALTTAHDGQINARFVQAQKEGQAENDHAGGPRVPLLGAVPSHASTHRDRGAVTPSGDFMLETSWKLRPARQLHPRASVSPYTLSSFITRAPLCPPGEPLAAPTRGVYSRFRSMYQS